MILSEEVRKSTTRNRVATITPRSYNISLGRYTVTMEERGKVITRRFQTRTPNLTAARKVAQEWCR